jgi:predicted transcriptional regulator
MARRAAGKVALLSIHPQYAELIMDGKKRVEFRKVRFAKDVSHVVMYATSPVKKVVGIFEVAGIEVDSIDGLWRRFGDIGGIDENGFREYFRNRNQGIAIEVGPVRRLSKPVPLGRFGEELKAPHSFRYLARTSLRDLEPIL